MKTSSPDFLTGKQRIKFVLVTMPFVDISYIALVTYLSTSPLLSFGIGSLIAILGGISITLGEKFGRIHLFSIIAVTINCINAGLFCAVSGPAAPSFLAGMAYIAACIILLTNLKEMLLFITAVFISISIGSRIADKSYLEIIIYLCSLAIYASVLIRFSQLNIRQGKEIVKAKEWIEEKNKNITDSINYALRIQQAKLPEKTIIQKSLPQSFILFKPKDIVSGDFYFFYTKSDRVYLAAADCTGHGIPGALMSMIGMEKIEEAVEQFSQTSEILNHVNRRMKLSLKQTGSDDSTGDGMDVAFCIIDMQKGLVNYAGANRPIWIIRKGGKAIEEIKATKTSIGGLTADDMHFVNHELQLHAGDTFYIFSDGFADTFGGKKNKKLTTKKFKELLLSIQHLDIKEQGQYLDNFIEDWKSGTEQVDDILVMGVEVAATGLI